MQLRRRFLFDLSMHVDLKQSYNKTGMLHKQETAGKVEGKSKQIIDYYQEKEYNVVDKIEEL